MGGGGGGKKGGGQTSTTSSYTQPYTPYLNYADQAMQKAQQLGNASFQPYDISQMFAPFNATQNQAFQQVQNLQGSYQPYFNNANTALSGVSGLNPVTAAGGYFSQAGQTPTALQAGQPYAQQASGTFNNPATVQSYMNPYITSSVNAANKLASQNFTQNVMPALNSQFVASGGGLGSPQYGNAANWALTNFNNSQNNATQQALAAGYGQAGQQFQSDQARLAGLSGTVGGQAAQTQAGLTGLGTAIGNNTVGGIGSGINLANAYGGLGTSQLNAGLLGSNALLQTGNQQQQQSQLPLTAAYNQFLQQQQWPYQTQAWANQQVNSFNWPSSTNAQTQSQSAGSPLGGVLGGLATIGSLAIPGAGGVSALGNLFGGSGGGLLSGLFGGGQGAITAPAGGNWGGLMFKRGGHFSGGDGASAPHFAELPNHNYARGGFYGGDDASTPNFQYPANTFDHRGFFAGGMDGASDPIWTHLPDNAYARGGEVPAYGPGGLVGGLIGSIFGGSGKEIGSDIGSGLEAILPFFLKSGGHVGHYADGGAADFDMDFVPVGHYEGMGPLVPPSAAAAGSDSAIAHEIEDRIAEDQANKAAQWFGGSLSGKAPSHQNYYDNGDPFNRRPAHEVQFNRGGFYGGDAASAPPFFEWADGYYNTGGYVPTIKAARGHYANEVRGYQREQREEQARLQAAARPLQFAGGGSVSDEKQDTRISKKWATKAMHRHERVMHGVKKKSELTPALARGGYFSR